MVFRDEVETSRLMSSADRMEPNATARNAELAAATDGDPAARWSALEACRDYLRLVVRRGRWSSPEGRSATSDLIQETIVDAWRNFSKFHGRTPGQLRAWLKAILIHGSLNARRRARPARIEPGEEAGVLASSTASPSKMAERNASRAALDRALVGLSERHRTVISLRIWEQLSFAEIGTKLTISEDAARMLYGRALTKLRDAMRPGHGSG
jgi:RNA polymerase sigma-70 factor, ECF subfamily